MKTFFYAANLMMLMFAGNAAANVIVDPQGVDEKQYAYDLQQCTALSTQVEKREGSSGGILRGAVKGAAAGAVIGGVTGGSGSDGAKTGAGIGIAGTLLKKGAERRRIEEEYEYEKDQVLKSCMINRGYKVLN
ncbi:glycine zipper family protein [Shewanella litorisediminis]|uniref:Glycine zipper family protein n=1 Tax=Shewanella litorisediminis TaxID=1173586 RepID=A0ABX7FYP9_9GAMM|nr:glycine zipper family protein [Shewanella litorisediminis]MCL2919238.1 glycine zipper family protein [Shewanella litorisediminis]QRH00167.1 glycine zipper family protein [Shewanella litorisediminis]